MARCNQRRELGKIFDKTPEIQDEMGEFPIPVRDYTTERQKNFKMYFFGRYV